MSLYVLVALVGTMQLPHANEGQKWHADYGEALKAAREANKPLLIVMLDASAKTPVSRVSRTEEGRVLELLGKYELCQIDVGTKYGQDVAKAFEANDVPFTVIIDKAATKQIYRRAGTFDDGQWTALLARYQNGTAAVSYRREMNFSSGFSAGGFSRGRGC